MYLEALLNKEAFVSEFIVISIISKYFLSETILVVNHQ